MATKKSGSDDELRNPLTGGAPNSYTSLPAGRTLPEPRNVRVEQARAKMPGADRSRLRRAHQVATEPRAENGFEPKNAPVTGYGKPEGVENRTWSWMTGAHHMFPNMGAENGNPAINEPHAGHPGVTVQRRAEDLSGKEYAKGEAALRNYGHDPRNPTESLVKTQTQNLHRVIGEHAAAGVEENASQHFYGGNPIQTHLPDDELQIHHEEGVTAAHGRFLEGVHNVANHPDFQAATPGMSHRERLGAATSLMAQATADTSPNNRWRQSSNRWPNLEQAEESANAGVEQRSPRHIGGRPQNTFKASSRVGEMTYGAHGFADDQQTGTGERFAPHSYGNPETSAKTVAFRGALVDQNATDSYKVSDVHEAGQILPGASSSKATYHRDSSGKRVQHFPEQPEGHLRGTTPETDDNAKQMRGNSRAENMLADGDYYVHAINDHATRRVAAEHGLSRSPNHADNVHPIQAAQWGSQQVRRTDPQMADVSHADQYPVVRDWGAEGSAEGIRPEYKHMFHGVSGQLSPQFVKNPNTSGMHNPMRRAYPLEPELGESNSGPTMECQEGGRMEQQQDWDRQRVWSADRAQRKQAYIEQQARLHGQDPRTYVLPPDDPEFPDESYTAGWDQEIGS